MLSRHAPGSAFSACAYRLSRHLGDNILPACTAAVVRQLVTSMPAVSTESGHGPGSRSRLAGLVPRLAIQELARITGLYDQRSD